MSISRTLRDCFIVSACLVAAPALAQQLPQPRCGGFPPTNQGPGPSGPGLIVAAPGVKCYGQLLNQIGGTLTLTNMRLKQAPSGGTFTVTGLRTFEFTPASNASGWSTVVLELEWKRATGPSYDTRVYRITTPDDYKRAGGTPTRPPPEFFRR